MTNTGGFAGEVLPFVELEFTYSLGPPVGAYVVESEEDNREVLILRLIDAPRPGRPRRRGARRLTSGEPVNAVPLLSVIHLNPRREGNARELAERCARSAPEQLAWAEDALGVLNRAIRAHRAQAGDPYFSEVTISDPRTVRIGFGEASDLVRGVWTEAWEVGSRPRETGWRDGEIGRSSETVAAALAGMPVTTEADELLLRGLLDIEQGRLRAAAVQLHGAAALFLAEEGDSASSEWGQEIREALLLLTQMRDAALEPSPERAHVFDEEELWAAATSLSRALGNRRQELLAERRRVTGG